MSSKKFELPAGWQTVGAGYLIYKPGWPDEFKQPDAVYENAGKRTNIVMADVDASGARDKEDIIRATVIKCGQAANRQTIEPFKKEIQDQINYPYPVGTALLLRNVTRWRVGANEYALQSFDVVRAFPPGVNPYDVMADESEQLKKVLAQVAKGERS